ncbi:hypothetical protein [Simkania sp.]|uniref:hypothetical protein n=1 Tax=Simkania sp. TaxID=34094 RepID=UPI003B518993
MQSKKFSLSKYFFISILLIGIAFGGYKVYDMMRDKALAFDIHHVVGKGQGIESWIKFNPKEEKFSVQFPKKPEHITKDFPIPRSDDTLPYHEFQCCEGERVISVSYTVLPQDWLKWGSKMVLKGAMKVVVNQLKGAHLVGQSTNTFKSFPSLDFEHYMGDQETAGTLILVGNVLYKVEISYPVHEREQVHNQLAQFIESFNPTNG